MKSFRTPMRKAERKVKLICIGGPFDKQTIELNDNVPVCSAYFSVASYGNETGRYIRDKEYISNCLWQPK